MPGRGRSAASAATSRRVKRILLLGATFATDNRGVGALASGAITILRKRFPGAEISFLDYGVRSDLSLVEVNGEQVQVPLVNLRFSWKILLRNNVAYLLTLAALGTVFGSGFTRHARARNRWLASICDADLAVAVSGGDSFSDIYGLGRFFYVYLPQVLVVLLGTKLVLLPQTIGPFKGVVARSLAAWLMRRAEVVYSREDTGLQEAHALLEEPQGSTKVRFCYDLGFVLEPREPKGENSAEVKGLGRSGRLLVGLNVSGLLWMGGYTRDNAFGLKVDYRALVEQTIEFLVAHADADVVLVPHVFGSREESDSLISARICEELGDRFHGRLACLRGRYDQNEIKYAIGRCDFFIGARMHACIAALSQAIPAVGIAYSKKFLGVFETVGAGDLVADPRRLDAGQIMEIVARALQNRDALRARLGEAMAGVRARLFATLDEVG